MDAHDTLPIAQFRQALLDAVQEYPCLIVVGDTGSGKTTQLPQYILGLSEAVAEQPPVGVSHSPARPKRLPRVAVTQPRRIAAVSAAKRVAEEQHVPLGSKVGYHIRFEKLADDSARLMFMTDGILLREACEDPSLSSWDYVLLDEAHERSLETDILFGLLRRALRLRTDLKVVIMSATLDMDKFSDFFGDCPIFSIPGRMFVVDILWQKTMKLATLKSTFVQRSVETVLHIHKEEEPGDILVFLTGRQDIESAISRLYAATEDLARSDIRHSDQVWNVVAYPIYSSLESVDQRAIFDPPKRGYRKVIFATNIAQTSITIPGIRYVVDSGFVKQTMYDPKTSMDALVVVPISQATATQRAGRAGRTAAGKVYRLYSRQIFDAMDIDTAPEIQRSSLIGTVLALKRMGIDDVLNFEFIDPPEPELVICALRDLFLLGALDECGGLTPLGRQMSSFSISPHLARALIGSSLDHGCAEEMLTIVALLSVEDIYITPRSPKQQDAAAQAHKQFAHPLGDHMTLLQIYEQWKRAGFDRQWARTWYFHHRALLTAKSVRSQLEETMKRNKLVIRSCALPDQPRRPFKKARHGAQDDDPESALADIRFNHVPILKALCAAFFMNTAKRHPTRALFYKYQDSSASASANTNQESKQSNHLLGLTLHPQSSLSSAALTSKIEWVIYHDIQFVNRAVMRCASQIDFSMVEALLRRSDNLDISKLAAGVPSDTAADRPGTTSRRASWIDQVSSNGETYADGSGCHPEDGLDASDGDAKASSISAAVTASEFESVLEIIDEGHHSERPATGATQLSQASGAALSIRMHSRDLQSCSHAPSCESVVSQRPESLTTSSESKNQRDQDIQSARERYLARKRKK
ncbi:P-loop containing nucleoside triphosphate hydrolase protein [Polychytrium aggregatum]|uniref:P-loop containing nucleoside triphosphate hydrolase protein n=1 Tax=Polychytrium aggregatum TaxID=110093 RepID=UPI0022FDCAF5|nr:P-loop containing nucleoside triphosphate hydrolase protein [Polychytrium aggregatum]KAI9193353.1 P-loop containing nucleoside triphosphate hydrolase protein [Polychytrium aggregatum]